MLALVLASTAASAAEIDFNRDVRPILSRNCFHCHGPDEEERKAGLRLDVESAAKKTTDGVAGIVEGKPDESLIIQRIFATDADDRMPPPEAKKTLTKKQKQILRNWIAQGAEYQDHWAFLPIKRSKPPAVRKKNFVRNPIDQFVLEKLGNNRIEPSPEADAGTLAKRIYIDLVGLLPSPDEVSAFRKAFAKDRDEAVKSLATRLLPTDAHGERWGRHWLDQARYADSQGYTIDGDRIMWPYRDWVIRAIRDNMPFDRFTIEQLAGDLLPNPTKAQLVATGFHRNTLINQEGGTDNEQFRNEEVVDRVNTTGAVWLGLTLGCAQCHTHKFDPITHQEYFEMFAFFNHTEDVNNTGPTVEVYQQELLLDKLDPKIQAQLNHAKMIVSRLERTKSERQEDWEYAYLKKTAEARPAVWSVLRPVEFTTQNGSLLEQLSDHSLLGKIRQAAQEHYFVGYDTGDAESIAAIRLRVLPHKSLPKNGPGLAGNGNFVLTRVIVKLGDREIPIVSADSDHAQPRFPILNVIDGKKETGWAINVGRGTPKGVKMNTEHEAQFTLAKPIKPDGKPLRVELWHEKNNHYNIGRFAIDASPNAPPPVKSVKLIAALKTQGNKRTADQKKLLTAEFAKADGDLKAAKADVSRVQRQLGFGPSAKAMITRELKSPRETYVHIRGDFLRKDKERGKLLPGVPAVFPAPNVAKHERVAYANRLDLARWLVSTNNPLTARVTVNRVWMRYFGRGLVETENDFGTQGTYPTHPDLLDWLAHYLMDNDWSMHALHKLIVSSATYRQSSNHRPDLNSVDKHNLLLARQNRIRYDAEIIRDVALSASGMLTRKTGGPSVRPPQPAGVYAFTQTKKNWTPDTGANRYRRGMYTRFYRSAPYPMMTTFDSPDFQSVCTSRPRSNTPLQSLTMANDETFFEFAQGLASRLLKDVEGTGTPADRERVTRAFEYCFCRKPSGSELDSVVEYLEQQRERFETDVEAAKTIAGKSLASKPVQGASWVALSRGLMNTDEFITRE
ncbi:MAG: hypothetical protein CMO80_04465 [Verrucomicrobiales bacterium]|nr:hypothetical protein [Verrucomicrobiales bacterium]|tara:strand:+ start:13143 stop:16187 length:3045 start_codon:yes stop_codon:yes gene_type:complete